MRTCRNSCRNSTTACPAISTRSSIGPISEAGLDKKFAKGVASGKPIISTVNPVSKSTVTSKMTVDFTTMGVQTGTYLVDFLKGKTVKVGTFPGPSGSGWAEAFLDGFKKAVKGKSNIKMLDDKFGDSGVAVQFGLIQNALQAYPDMNVIWGCAPAAEAAIGAVAQAGTQGRADHVVLRESGDARRVEQR